MGHLVSIEEWPEIFWSGFYCGVLDALAAIHWTVQGVKQRSGELSDAEAVRTYEMAMERIGRRAQLKGAVVEAERVARLLSRVN